MKLFSTPFTDLLPSSVREDARFKAAAEALDRTLWETDAHIREALIWSRIDELTEPLLSNLAWQLHLEAHEGWHLAETLDQKRRLVKDAIILHFYKGTLFSTERALQLLDMRGRILEWFDYPEDPDFRPYEFDIEIDVLRPINEQLYYDLNMLIDALKNVRSHRRKLKFYLTPKPAVIYVGIASLYGITLEVYPLGPEDVELVAVIRSGGAQHHVINMEVVPMHEEIEYWINNLHPILHMQMPGVTALPDDLWEVH